MTYASSYPSAQYIINVNSNTLTLLTAVSSLTILNTFLGYIGLLRHYKSILIAYLVFLWPLLLSYIAVGYLSYVANASSGSSLSGVWGQLSDIQKESIQNQYVCCGFLSELDRVTSSQQCNIIDTTSSSLVTKRELTNSIYQNYINSESTKVATVGINKRTPLKRNTGNGMLESLGFQKSINSDKLMKRQSQGSLGLPGCFLTWGRVSSDYLHILTNLGFTSIPFFALAFVIGVLSANHIYD